MSEGELIYRACDTDGNEERCTITVGTSLITSVLTRTSTDLEGSCSYVSMSGITCSTKTWAIPVRSTITTKAESEAATIAPAVQLVWRPSGLPQTTNTDLSATTTPAPSGTSAPHVKTPLATTTIVGIAVGAVAFTATPILAILYLRRRQRRGDGASTSGETGKLEPGQKPELDATPALQIHEAAIMKQELPAESGIPPRAAAREPKAFELDAAAVVTELPAKQDALKMPVNQKAVGSPVGGAGTALGSPDPIVSPVSLGSPSQPPYVNSSPSVLSSVGGHDSHMVERWRASIP
jgi:hypothetical protein